MRYPINLRQFAKRAQITFIVVASVVDPNPDPYVCIWPPGSGSGSGSISQRYGMDPDPALDPSIIMQKCLK